MLLLLLILLCLSCVGLVGWGFTGPNRCLRFCSLMGASMTGFIVPQVIGQFNSSDKTLTIDGSLQMFVIMAILCMVAAVAGDYWGYHRSGARLRRLGDYNWRRLMDAALMLNAVAIMAAFVGQVMMPDEIASRTRFQGGMSGAGVIVIFFAAVHRYGFALALLLYWERRSVLALAMILLGAANYLYTIIALSRRGPAIEFVFIVLLTYAMGRRRQISPVLISILFIVGTFWSDAINDFRGRGDWMDKVEGATYIESFMNLLDHGGGEVRNGCEVIGTTYAEQSYEWGKLHWNKLVHAYFPGQVFGYDNKEGLKFAIEDIADERNRSRGMLGVTATGMSDCFTSFGFFGCLKYVAIGFVMGRWYRRAFAGDLAARLAFSTLMSAALHTISHGTYWLLNEYIHMAIFSYPVLYWAQKSARPFGMSGARHSGQHGAEPLKGLAPGLR
jgi:hypothetical protein